MRSIQEALQYFINDAKLQSYRNEFTKASCTLSTNAALEVNHVECVKGELIIRKEILYKESEVREYILDIAVKYGAYVRENFPELVILRKVEGL